MLDVIADNEIGVYWGPEFIITNLFYHIYIHINIAHSFFLHAFSTFHLIMSFSLKWLQLVTSAHVCQEAVFHHPRRCQCQPMCRVPKSRSKGYLRAAWLFHCSEKINGTQVVVPTCFFFSCPNIFGLDAHRTSVFRGLPIGWCPSVGCSNTSFLLAALLHSNPSTTGKPEFQSISAVKISKVYMMCVAEYVSMYTFTYINVYVYIYIHMYTHHNYMLHTWWITGSQAFTHGWPALGASVWSGALMGKTAGIRVGLTWINRDSWGVMLCFFFFFKGLTWFNQLENSKSWDFSCFFYNVDCFLSHGDPQSSPWSVWLGWFRAALMMDGHLHMGWWIFLDADLATFDPGDSHSSPCPRMFQPKPSGSGPKTWGFTQLWQSYLHHGWRYLFCLRPIDGNFMGIWMGYCKHDVLGQVAHKIGDGLNFSSIWMGNMMTNHD